MKLCQNVFKLIAFVSGGSVLFWTLVLQCSTVLFQWLHGPFFESIKNSSYLAEVSNLILIAAGRVVFSTVSLPKKLQNEKIAF